MKRFSTILFCLLLAAPAFAQWTKDPNLPRRIKLYNANDSLFVPLINGQAIRQGASLSDTTKSVSRADSATMPGYFTLTAGNAKLAKSDSATMPGYATLTALATKAASSTVVAKADSATMPGYFTLTAGNAKVAKSDSATMPGYATLTALATKAASSIVVAKADSATMPGYFTLTAGNAKVAKSDSATMPGYVTLTAGNAKMLKSDSTTLFNEKLGGWTWLYRTSDTTNALLNAGTQLGQLQFTMAASATYEIEGRIYVTRANAANAYTFGLNCGGTPTNVGIIFDGLASNTDAVGIRTQANITTGTDSLVLTATTLTTTEFISIAGILTCDGSNRLFTFRYHPEVNASGTTIKQGSWIRYRRLI